MAYIVQTTTNNGYRCGCCYRSWEDTKIVDTLEEALEYVPTELETDALGGELEEVEVKDGATGELIAWGRLSYPRGRKADLYKASRWSGYRGDEKFDSHSDEEWKEITRKIEREKLESQIRSEETKLKAAQKNLAHYRRLLDEL